VSLHGKGSGVTWNAECLITQALDEPEVTCKQTQSTSQPEPYLRALPLPMPDGCVQTLG